MINPKPSGKEFPKTRLTSRMCCAVDPNTLYSGLVAPHGTVGAVSGGGGLSTLVSKVKKRELQTGVRMCVCVSVSRGASA